MYGNDILGISYSINPESIRTENAMFFRSEISNSTENSTNYTLHAKKSSIVLSGIAHFYSSEVQDKNNKHNRYGVYLEDSELSIGFWSSRFGVNMDPIGIEGSVRFL